MKIELTEEEIENLKEHNKNVSFLYGELGRLRKGFVIQEEKIVNSIEKLENEFRSLIQLIAKNKKVPEGWYFDMETFSFMEK